jgi:hypothetical protein
MLLLACSQLLFAQKDTFQIKDYKFRTPGFKALQINFSLGGNSSAQKNMDGFTKQNSSFGLSPSSINFFQTSSTDKRLHTSYIDLGTGLGLSSETINGKTVSMKSLGSNLRWHRDDRFFKRNNWFFEVGNHLNIDGKFDKRKDSINTLRYSEAVISNQLMLGFGKGRIEWVQDAQMALFILNDLQQQGLIQGDISRETAYNFATLITDINNRRIFDFRRRRIYELSRIDSFMKNSGLVTSTDIRHFTTINDNWALAFNPFRLSGSNWFIRLRPSISYYFRKMSGENLINSNMNRFVSTQLGISPQIGYEKQIPVSLQWQKMYGINASYTLLKEKGRVSTKTNGVENSFDAEHYEEKIDAAIFYGIGYFPNNRTIIRMNMGVGAVYRFFNETKILTINPRLDLNAGYFLGYRTYLTAQATFDYTKRHIEGMFLSTENTRLSNLYFNIGVSHFIF